VRLLRRRRRSLIGDAFVVLHSVEDDVDGVHPNEPAVVTENDSDRQSARSAAGRDLQVRVVFDSRPCAVVAAGGAVPLGTAAREEVLEFPTVDGSTLLQLDVTVKGFCQ
jgi:hypothetical protein